MATTTDLMQPIEGISVEKYAQLQAIRFNSEQDFQKQLQKDGIAMDQFARSEKGWNDRLSADYQVGAAYGLAFSAAGVGKFGAASQTATGTMQQIYEASYGSNTLADGVPNTMAMYAAIKSFNPPPEEAPMTFEKYCEICGAQAAWAKSGNDVNAMLRETFDMSALDYSNASMYFMGQMTTDEFSKLTGKYEKQYAAAKENSSNGGDNDDDIEF